MTPTRWLWAIILVAAALRIFPVWFGLPYLYARPDEAESISRASGILAGDLNPHFFHWPSLTFYLFAAGLGTVSGIRSLGGIEPSLPVNVALITARTLVAIAGALTVVPLFRLGRRMAGQTAGLLGAGCLAVVPLHVRDSHFAMTDVLMTLFVVLALGCLVRAAAAASNADALRWSVVGGVVSGLAASTKYSAAALVVAMLAAQATRGRQGRASVGGSARAVLLFCAAAAAGFLVGTPFALLDAATFARDVLFDVGHLAGGHRGVELGRGWGYHLTHSLPYGVGLPVFAAATAGIAPLARTYPALAAVTGAFAVAFYLAIGSGYTVFFRYVLPLVPVLCLLAAAGVLQVADWMFRRLAVAPPAALGILLALTAGPALVQSLWFDAVLARTDTRVLAGAWLEPHLTPETTVHDAGNAYTALNIWRRPFERWEYDPASGRFRTQGDRLPEWLVLYESPLDAYTAVPESLWRLAQARYTLAYSVVPVRESGEGAVYDRQDAFFMPISGFSRIERPGPSIFIFRRSDTREVAVRTSGAHQRPLEDRHQVGLVEAALDLGVEFVERRLDAERAPVRTLGRKCVEHVGDCGDLREEGDRAPRQPVGIAAAVEAFVMAADDRTHRRERAQLLAQALADHRVLPHGLNFGEGERPGLEQDGIGDRDLAKIVQVAPAMQRLDVVVVETERRADAGGVAGEPLAVPFGIGVARLDGEREAENDLLGVLEIVGEAFDARERPQPGVQLDPVERLGHEVVGPRLDGAQAVGAVHFGGHEHDRHEPGRRVGFQLATRVEAVPLRHPDVHEDHVGRLLHGEADGVERVGRLDDFHFRRVEQPSEEPEVLGHVVDRQHTDGRSLAVDEWERRQTHGRQAVYLTSPGRSKPLWGKDFDRTCR